MNREKYISQGHPTIIHNGVEDDVCCYLEDYAQNNGLGAYENGGEFDYDVEDKFIYNLYNDDGDYYQFELIGELKQEILMVSEIINIGFKKRIW